MFHSQRAALSSQIQRLAQGRSLTGTLAPSITSRLRKNYDWRRHGSVAAQLAMARDRESSAAPSSCAGVHRVGRARRRTNPRGCGTDNPTIDAISKMQLHQQLTFGRRGHGVEKVAKVCHPYALTRSEGFANMWSTRVTWPRAQGTRWDDRTRIARRWRGRDRQSRQRKPHARSFATRWGSLMPCGMGRSRQSGEARGHNWSGRQWNPTPHARVQPQCESYNRQGLSGQ